jgi:hypothetical protein
MKEKFTAFMDGLITYDYILFATIFALFILLLIFAILLRKRLKSFLFVLLLSFITLFAGPTLGYKEMHKYLFKNSITLTSQKKLTFTPAIVIKASVKNESNFNFQRCKITATVHKASKNRLKNYIYQFKVLQKMSILEDNIVKDETRIFKMIVEPFNYKKDYNITLKASCK